MKVVGINLKKLREKQGLTLRGLAKQVNVSASFISQIEQCKAAPSLVTIKEIADALLTTVGTLLGEDLSPEKHVLLKKNQRRAIKKIGNGISMEILTEPDLNKHMEVLLFFLKKGATSGVKMYQHFGQEFVLVQKGKLEITLNEKIYNLDEADSLYFNSGMPHSFRNKNNGVTEVLWVITPPSF